MSTGLKIYNQAGALVLDMTSSISQMMGYVDTGSANGAVSIPLPPAGKTLFHVVADIGQQSAYLGKRPGVVMAIDSSGASISWTYSYAAGWGFYSMNCRIHYGYY
ncbi:hypothetical protein VA602_18100 [Pseudomonas sp. MH2]|uniref:Uncharacterized protein n=1 Tax=Pseudomonas machongensis TaxID=3110229 RepID=A0ABU5VIN0_9PSED|nr:hypothetical protein [Pseudomonas sp. MH2]MEA5673237.1 hypothetical protein [Pseudomonas sp. MH2]